MLIRFDEICDHIIDKYEGSISTHPDDPGGLTKWGIASRYHPEAKKDSFTREHAKAIYKAEYWNKMRCDLVKEHYRLMFFDMGVNPGVKRAAKLIQKVVGVKRDGVIGPVTLNAIARYPEDSFLPNLAAERILYYMTRRSFTTFGRGWIRRSVDVLLGLDRAA